MKREKREINGLNPQGARSIAQRMQSTAVHHIGVLLRDRRAQHLPPDNVAKATAYSLTRWVAPTRFLDDGRLCIL